MKSIQENTNLEHLENADQKGQVYSEIIRVKDKNSRGQWLIFTINTKPKAASQQNSYKFKNLFRLHYQGYSS